MQKLQSFHRRAVRYITGVHIRKLGKDNWFYPDHEKLLKQCKLFGIEIYIERRRGTLRRYLEKNKPDLLLRAGRVRKHGRDVHKLLWWNQKWRTRADVGRWSNFWFDT